MVTMKKHFELL